MTTDDQRAAVIAAAVALRDALTALRYVDESYPPDVRHQRLREIWAAQDAIVNAVAEMQAAERAAEE